MNENAALDAVHARNVSFTWTGRSPFRMDVPDFSISSGETVLLLGESGSGKSTLLSLICGVVAPAKGEIEVGGTNLSRLSTGARDRFRANHIGVIFQQFNLLSYATALDNVLLALQFSPDRRNRIGDARKEALRLTTALGLPELLVEHSTAAGLSVGQQQRVAVARALIGAPALIVADEPTSSLDASSQESFLDLLFTQVKAANSTLLMVSHDQRLGARFDRVVDLARIAQIERGKAS